MWRKSSYGNGDGGSCVEVADGFPGTVPVRDSKAVPEEPALTFAAASWPPFIHAIRNGTL